MVGAECSGCWAVWDPTAPGDLVPETRQSLCQHWAELLLAGKAEEQLDKRGFRQGVRCCSGCMVLAGVGTLALIVLLFVL